MILVSIKYKIKTEVQSCLSFLQSVYTHDSLTNKSLTNIKYFIFFTAYLFQILNKLRHLGLVSISQREQQRDYMLPAGKLCVMQIV